MTYYSCAIRANNQINTPSIWSLSGDVEGKMQAVMIDPQIKIGSVAENRFITIAESLALSKQYELDSLPRISREEFFGEMPNIYIFPVYYPNVGVLHSIYEYEEGMTWGEWCDSKYNTLGYTLEVYASASRILGLDPEYGKTGLVWCFDSKGNGNPVASDDPIKNMYYYLQITE